MASLTKCRICEISMITSEYDDLHICAGCGGEQFLLRVTNPTGLKLVVEHDTDNWKVSNQDLVDYFDWKYGETVDGPGIELTVPEQFRTLDDGTVVHVETGLSVIETQNVINKQDQQKGVNHE
jgi:hypothetical protein